MNRLRFSLVASALISITGLAASACGSSYSAPSPTPPRYARPRSGSDRRRVVAVILALLASMIVVLVALSGGDDSSGGGGQQATQAKEGRERASAAEGAGESSQPAASDEGAGEESEAAGGAQAAPPLQASEAGPARGSALNEQGFAMIGAGEYEAAVPVLEEAVSSFPEGTDDLNYAYALFNLGNALRLSGRPEEAIPILERRLEIPNQEGEVRKELEAAYAEAGEPTSFKED